MPPVGFNLILVTLKQVYINVHLAAVCYIFSSGIFFASPQVINHTYWVGFIVMLNNTISSKLA